MVWEGLQRPDSMFNFYNAEKVDLEGESPQVVRTSTIDGNDIHVATSEHTPGHELQRDERSAMATSGKIEEVFL